MDLRFPGPLLLAAAFASATQAQAQQPVLGTWGHVGMLPGYSEMFVADIDNTGRIVGGVWGAGGASTSVLYSNGRLSEITNLGLPGGSAADISNTGYIAGGALDRRDPPRTIAYMRHPDGSTYTLPGPPAAAYSSASHVNDFGEAVGTAYLQDPSSPDAVQSAFLYDRNGQRHTLGWGAYTVATGLNNAGQAVGQGHRPGSDAVRAFTWRNGTTTDLGTLGGAIATTAGINEAGQIAGTSTLAGSLSDAPRHAYLWDNGVMADLGTLGGRDSNAWDLNDAGDVVGGSAVDGSGLYHHAFLWRDGKMHDLGTFGGRGSVALQVNERGDVAGVAELDELDYKGNPVRHAFLWRDGRLIDLSASLAASFNDISQIDPYSVHINDVGHVTLYGITAGGLRGIFLLTPIPEPATWALLLAGALALWSRRLRRRVGNAAGLAAVCFAFAAGPARAQVPGAPPAWQVVNIGSLPGSTLTVGLDFNDLGQVVGYARFMQEPTNDFMRPVLYSNGRLVDIGMAGTRGGYASAINNSGRIAGSLQGMPGSSIGFTWRAFVHDGGRTTLLDIPAGMESTAEALNERGDVIVSSGPDDLFSRRGHLFRADGTRVDLPGLGGSITRPHGLNERGQVVGEASLAGSGMGIWQPFLYDQGRMVDLAPAGSFGNARAINEQGVAVGTLGPSDHAAVFANGTAIDLGTLGGGAFSHAQDINDANQVIGTSQVAGGEFHAFLYEGGSLRDLHDFFAGSRGTFASDINNLGQVGIEASFLAADGGTYTRAFLLDHGTVTDLSALIGPDRSFVEGTLQLNEAGQVLLGVRDNLSNVVTPYLITPVPEPQLLALMLAGLLALGTTASRRRRGEVAA